MSRPQDESTAQPGHLTAQFVVDASVLAHGGLTWERKFSDIRFERLVDMALSVQPAVSIKLKFGLLDQRPTVDGQMQADVELTCQRCMNAMLYRADESFALMLVESAAGLPLVPESHEPWIANAARLNLLELIEEQLLLALPLIAKHADERQCVSVTAASNVAAKPKQQASQHAVDVELAEEVQRPFGNLRQLLRKD